jgi:hypothetical protein
VYVHNIAQEDIIVYNLDYYDNNDFRSGIRHNQFFIIDSDHYDFVADFGFIICSYINFVCIYF